MRRLVIACAVVTALPLAAACKGGSQDAAPAESAEPNAPTPRPDELPPDHLARGELVEGTEKAFGLLLPRGAKVDGAMVDVIYASTNSRAEDVSNYIRARVRMASVTVGASGTMFDRAQVPTEPGRELAIRVEPGPNGGGAKIVLRIVKPMPIEPGLEENQRWNKVGLTPDGRIADPKHFQ